MLINKASSIFCPLLVTPKNAIIKDVEAISRSQRLMTELGLIKPNGNGTFHIMPIAQRSIDKCINLVQRRMQRVGGQKITMPILTSSALWKKSGRLDGDITEFYMLNDRHGKRFLLSPTHEEAVTAMLSSIAPISYRQLPLRLYQIGPKFRDELKARFGLIRAKEFLMKDMYTFDVSEGTATNTYNELNIAYETLFKQLEVPFVKVEACAGMMGGLMSHEYHYVAATGEDRIMQCNHCKYAFNEEISDMPIEQCPKCRAGALESLKGIEVGHTFLLGDKYSQPLGATFLQESGKPKALIMGCYGIGITRLVAAALESLSTEKELRWPILLAPFDVCVIGPKQGSKEQSVGEAIEIELCKCLSDLCGVNNILHDDRKYLTIGKRFMDAKRMGYPIIVVIGAKSMEQVRKVEIHVNNVKSELEPNGALREVSKYIHTKMQLLNMEAEQDCLRVQIQQ